MATGHREGEQRATGLGAYTQLVDQMAKQIALNTKTAIDEIGAAEQEELLKEAQDLYEAELEGWDDFVERVLVWLGRTYLKPLFFTTFGIFNVR